MKNILIVDVQKGYVDERHNQFIKNLNKYLKSNIFDTVVYTRFVTNHENDEYKNVKWFGLYDKTERKLAVKKIKGKTFNKRCHGLTPTIIKYLKDQNVKEIELCGLDNLGSIELIENLLKKNEIHVEPLKDLITSSKIVLLPETEPYQFQIKTLNGFYIGDIVANNFTTFTDETILSFAVIEWLLHSNKSTQEFQKILNYYFKLYPNINNIYEEPFAKWLENGCRTYRVCESFDGAKILSSIGYYAECLGEVDDLVNATLSATHNTFIAKEGAKIICYAIWLLKFKTAKNELLSKLNNFFAYDFTDNFEQSKNLFFNERTPINFARAVLCAFVNSKSFEDALKKAESYGFEQEALMSTTASIAEAYYAEVPHELIKKCREILPEKFKNLLIDLGKSGKI